jgi:hypothetical protein
MVDDVFLHRPELAGPSRQSRRRAASAVATRRPLSAMRRTSAQPRRPGRGAWRASSPGRVAVVRPSGRMGAPTPVVTARQKAAALPANLGAALVRVSLLATAGYAPGSRGSPPACGECNERRVACSAESILPDGPRRLTAASSARGPAAPIEW